MLKLCFSHHRFRNPSNVIKMSSKWAPNQFKINEKSNLRFWNGPWAPKGGPGRHLWAWFGIQLGPKTIKKNPHNPVHWGTRSHVGSIFGLCWPILDLLTSISNHLDLTCLYLAPTLSQLRSKLAKLGSNLLQFCPTCPNLVPT